MVYYCVVPNCPNRIKKSGNIISYHKFPMNDPHLLNQWLLGLDIPDYKPTNSSKICSAHFERRELNFSKDKNFTLRKFAVPTILPKGNSKKGYYIAIPNIKREVDEIWSEAEERIDCRKKFDNESTSSSCSTCTSSESGHDSDSDIYTDNEHSNDHGNTIRKQNYTYVSHDHFYTGDKNGATVTNAKYEKVLHQLNETRKRLRGQQQVTRRLKDQVLKLKDVIAEQKKLLDRL